MIKEVEVKELEKDHFARSDGSLYRLLKNGTKKELTQTKQEFGMIINSRVNHVIKNVFVHDLIAKNFKLNKNNHDDKVRHIDGDILNNNIHNLEYVNNLYEFNTEKRIHSGLDMMNINHKLWVRSDGNIIEFNYKTSEYSIKKIKQDYQGYISINVVINGTRVSKKVHRLVAEIFIDKIDGKDFVDHINEDKTDNSVGNLRWCTQNENIEYYNTKNGKNHKLAHRQKIKDDTKNLLKEIKRLSLDLEKKEKKINILEDKLIEKEKKFAYDIKKQLEILSRSKQGYQNISGMKFESKEVMIRQTGKPITIDGIRYESCGSAAAYIVDCEANVGKIKKKNTISKELRRYLKGDRDKWKMYGKYSIGY